MNNLTITVRNRLLDVVGDLAMERYPKARGHQGLMQEIALDEFGVRLTKDRESYWKNGTIKDEQKFMMFVLKHLGVDE